MLLKALIVAVYCASCTTTRLPTPQDALDAFTSADAREANHGYRALFEHGADAIPLILQHAARTAPYAGTAHQDPSSSILATSPTQGVVLLYLVEAIRTNQQYPHNTALLVSTTVAAADIQARAADAYRAWWRGLTSTVPAAIRAAPDPLAGAGIEWR